MPEPELPTNFAPSGRSGADALNAQRREMERSGLFTGILATMPDLLLVLNENRQIVYANRSALEFLGVTGLEKIIGQRPGEAAACVNAEAPGGCGTGEKCSTCGAVLAILASQRGERASGECRLLTKAGGRTDAFDLKVTAVPITVSDAKFTVFYVSDVSHEKRRRALEHIFFHDVLNTAGSLEGFSEVMSEETDPQTLRGYGGTISRLSQRLIGEIVAQRELLKAESGELRPEHKMVPACGLLNNIAEMYSAHEAAKGKEIEVLPGAEVTLITDATLLSRVLGNMLKNALEASAAGEKVTLCASADSGRAVFTVHNCAVMPKDVKLQIFNRSFSTKGADRGLGTYSIKLLSERYLAGTVTFSSEEGAGTTFVLELPLGN
ncbi:MAG: GHKL domain-containing protein [Elusimicrobia bacterium]|nr:GHKL domain-containing protein [Elusimicrobiota bacterium]